jgi:CIC family chloride channel protein
VPHDPAPFVIVAMMALFGSVAHAPIAVMLMVAEMTGNLAMLPPAMIAIGVATLVVGEASIYASQLTSRADSPAHRFQFSLPLMATIQAAEVARSPRLVLRASDRVSDARERVRGAGVPGAPVLAPDGALVGTVSPEQLAAADASATVGSIADDSVPPIIADDTLDEVIGSMADHQVAWGPVVREGRLIGVLSSRDAMRAYRAALAGTVRRVRGLGPGGALVRGRLPAAGGIVGMAVSTVPWPRDVVVVAIRRGEELVVPRGDVVLQPGDDVTLFVATGARVAVETLLRAPLEEPAEA